MTKLVRTPSPAPSTSLLQQPSLLVGAALLTGFTAACSGGGGDTGGTGVHGGSSVMSVQGCSLGCSGVGISGEFTCESASIFVNQELGILFTQEVDLETVTKSTFQVVELTTGKAPTGSFSIDPTTPSRVLFRPQLTFDSSGTPIFGLKQNEQYLLKVPGAASDPPPYIRSTTGSVNQSRLECLIVADKGVNDPVDGPVSVNVFVEVVTAYDGGGNPIAFATGQPADGAVDVFRDSQVTFEFDDIMNPATLVNPVTQTSDFLTITVDPDGVTSDASDQVPISGKFTLDTDQELLRTTVIFTPSSGLPSAGSGAIKRKIVVNVPPGVVDLGGNGVSNAGQFIFTPESIAFPPIVLPGGAGEDFSTTLNRDSGRTGATWGGGSLTPGITGGAGYLGDLVVETSETVNLCTVAACPGTPEAFNTFQGLDVIQLGPDDVVPGVVPSATITDGLFQFSSVTVRSGGILTFVGANPGRTYGRGDVIIQGQVDLTGADPAANATMGHRSSLLSGGAAGAGGAGGGDGGDGGDRPNDATNPELLLVGGVPNPGADTDGGDGGGVGGLPNLGGGTGGAHWPPNLPTGVDQADWGDYDPSNPLTCNSDQVGQAGGGGAYTTDGTIGIADPPLLPNIPGPPIPTPDTPGGSSAEVAIGPLEMTLDPELGFLRGGAGGGGGGGSVHLSRTDGLPLTCGIGSGGGAPKIDNYLSHSGAGAGGGGGAAEFTGGARVVVDGVIDASGGDGGDSFGNAVPGQFMPDFSAAPGGAGSGGAVLLRSPQVQVASTPNRVIVNGGIGGDGVGKSVGGDGGIGLVRFEGVGLQAGLEAPKIGPFDAGDPTSSGFLSVAEIAEVDTGPRALSGGQSCWMKPEGNFFTVAFADDVPDGGGGTDLGWDMFLTTNAGGAPVSFRGDTSLLGDTVEGVFGSDLMGPSGAPIVVRFQGVRSIGELEDPCNVILSGPDATVVEESLTGWVRHPAELNTYWNVAFPGNPEEAAKRQPNMVRFQIIFDRTHSLMPEIITGVDSFFVEAQPD